MTASNLDNRVLHCLVRLSTQRGPDCIADVFVTQHPVDVNRRLAMRQIMAYRIGIDSYHVDR